MTPRFPKQGCTRIQQLAGQFRFAAEGQVRGQFDFGGSLPIFKPLLRHKQAPPQVLGWDVAPLPLVSDSFYGDSYDFRQQLRQRQLKYVVAVEPERRSGHKIPTRRCLPPNAQAAPTR